MLQLALEMALTIWISINFVNAIVFFFVDIPVVWAIHRGLLALQGYYLYRRAIGGHDVPIARSRIPIVTGELLRGSTKWPSIFEFINIGTYGMLFFATLGVDADLVEDWIPQSFQNITTLAMPKASTTIPNDIIQIGEGLGRNYRNLTCKTVNETHALFWPSAFDVKDTTRRTSSNKTEHLWAAQNLTCQEDAPGYSPLVTVQCTRTERASCHIDDVFSGWQFEMEVENKQNRTIFQNKKSFIKDWVEESNVSVPSILLDSEEQAGGYDGHVFSYYSTRTVFSCSNSSSVGLFRHRRTNTLYFVVGYTTNNNYFVTSMPLRISLHEPTSVDFLLHSFRTNFEVHFFFCASDFKRTFNRRADVFQLERIIRILLHSISRPLSTTAFKSNGRRPVTRIATYSLALYCVLILMGIVLLPMKEALIFFVVQRQHVTESNLFFGEYDELSKSYRSISDKLRGVRCTGEFTTLAMVQQDEQKVSSGNTKPEAQLSPESPEKNRKQQEEDANIFPSNIP